MYQVTCQHYYYSGLYAVEIAKGGIDYSGCDMLILSDKSLMRLTGSFDDPREAVNSAIKLQELWQKSKSNDVIWLSYGCNLDMIEGACCINDDGYADGGEAYSKDEMIAINQTEATEWAEKEYQSLEKCSRCQEILPEDYYTLPDFDCFDEKFCSEYCADETYAFYMQNDELEEVEDE